MSDYQQTNTDVIYDTVNQRFIPNDENNPTWNEYAEWESEDPINNVPDPPIEEPEPEPETFPDLVNYTQLTNLFVNGNFGIWQRNDYWGTLDSYQYTADRFLYRSRGDYEYICTRSTDVPTQEESKYVSSNSLFLECDNTDSLSSNHYITLEQRIEGYVYRGLHQNTGTLSFWVKSSKIGTYSVVITNHIDTSYVFEYIIKVSNTWEYQSHTLDFTPVGSNIEFNHNLGLSIVWSLTSGETKQTNNIETWTSEVKYTSSNQVNHAEIGNTFQLSQCQLIVGSQELTYCNRPYSLELLLAQRYFEKSYEIDDALATNTEYCMSIYPTGYQKNKYTGAYFPFKVQKRTAPIMQTWDAEGNINRSSTWDSKWKISHNESDDEAEFLATEVGFYFKTKVNNNKIGTVGRHWAAGSEL